MARMREEFSASPETAGMRPATGAAAWLQVFQAAQGGYVKIFTISVSEIFCTRYSLIDILVEPELGVDIEGEE